MIKHLIGPLVCGTAVAVGVYVLGPEAGPTLIVVNSVGFVSGLLTNQDIKRS